MKQIWKHRYQIMETLGKGGNGHVYKVWDLHLEKIWAMKVLEKECSRNHREREEEKHDEELQALKRMNHPLFPRIVDAFQEEDRNVLVMDYVEGIPLEEVIEKGPMEEKKILDIGSQIAEAIEYLHSLHPILLYLDLKPANILLEESGQIKLVDLGSVMKKGNVGRISGTPGFASPEQIHLMREGSLLGEQSDIYSFGMVLFSMATGNLSKLPIMEEGRRYGFFVRKYQPIISLGLERIIEKCTRGSVRKRYTNMRDVRSDLKLLEKRLGKKFRLWTYHQKCWLTFPRGEDWHQEKSILCTRGKASLYIAGRLIFLLIGVGIFIPSLDSLAKGYYEKNDVLEVTIRDAAMRKVLVKKGCFYETEESLLFEIPWEAIEGKECEIEIICTSGGKKASSFQINCKKRESDRLLCTKK